MLGWQQDPCVDDVKPTKSRGPPNLFLPLETSQAIAYIGSNTQQSVLLTADTAGRCLLESR